MASNFEPDNYEIPDVLVGKPFSARHLRYALKMFSLPSSIDTLKRYYRLSAVHFSDTSEAGRRVYTAQDILATVDAIAAYKGRFLPLAWKELIIKFLIKATRQGR